MTDLELPAEHRIGNELLEHARVLPPSARLRRHRVFRALEERRVVLADARRRRDGVARELLRGEDVRREEAEQPAGARRRLEHDDVAVHAVREVLARVERVEERCGGRGGRCGGAECRGGQRCLERADGLREPGRAGFDLPERRRPQGVQMGEEVQNRVRVVR